MLRNHDSRTATLNRNPDWPLVDIETPHANDVLCGRGGGTNAHPGNEQYRKLVHRNKVRYLSSSKRGKPKIARELVKIFYGMDPPTRFLEKNEVTDIYDDIGEERAIQKVSQALREGAPAIRKQIKAARASGNTEAAKAEVPFPAVVVSPYSRDSEDSYADTLDHSSPGSGDRERNHQRTLSSGACSSGSDYDESNNSSEVSVVLPLRGVVQISPSEMPSPVPAPCMQQAYHNTVNQQSYSFNGPYGPPEGYYQQDPCSRPYPHPVSQPHPQGGVYYPRHQGQGQHTSSHSNTVLYQHHPISLSEPQKQWQDCARSGLHDDHRHSPPPDLAPLNQHRFYEGANSGHSHDQPSFGTASHSTHSPSHLQEISKYLPTQIYERLPSSGLDSVCEAKLVADVSRRPSLLELNEDSMKSLNIEDSVSYGFFPSGGGEHLNMKIKTSCKYGTMHSLEIFTDEDEEEIHERLVSSATCHTKNGPSTDKPESSPQVHPNFPPDFDNVETDDAAIIRNFKGGRRGLLSTSRQSSGSNLGSNRSILTFGMDDDNSLADFENIEDYPDADRLNKRVFFRRANSNESMQLSVKSIMTNSNRSIMSTSA